MLIAWGHFPHLDNSSCLPSAKEVEITECNGSPSPVFFSRHTLPLIHIQAPGVFLLPLQGISGLPYCLQIPKVIGVTGAWPWLLLACCLFHRQPLLSIILLTGPPQKNMPWLKRTRSLGAFGPPKFSNTLQ